MGIVLVDEIEVLKKLAYRIFKRRCKSEIYEYGKIGSENGDWKQAEQEIKDRKWKLRNKYAKNIVKTNCSTS
jgi:hypothetical protein